MKILLIIDSLRVGGAQKLVVVFAKEMRKRNHQVEVVTLNKLTLDGPIEKELEKLGIQVNCFPMKNLGDLATINNLIHFIKSSKPDILHTQLFYANIIGTFAGRKAGVPCVASLHNATLYKSNWYKPRKWLETRMLNWFSRRIIACGYTVAAVQQSRFKKIKLTIIPNPIPVLPKVDHKEVEDFRRLYLNEGKGLLLVSVGRLIVEKGYPDMIQAMISVTRQTKQQIKLLIIGDGPLLEELQENAEKHGLGKIICFLGQRDDVSKILAASDIFISTSIFEGQSIAVLEAISAGLPVIVTDVGDNDRTISPESGVLVPTGCPELVAEHILLLMSKFDERKRLAYNANQQIINDLSPSLWADKLLNLYNEVLTK